MISTTKASEEREMVGETWEVFQNEENKQTNKNKKRHFGGISKTPGQSPTNQTLNLYHIK